jgi:pantothenate kinase
LAIDISGNVQKLAIDISGNVQKLAIDISGNFSHQPIFRLSSIQKMNINLE